MAILQTFPEPRFIQIYSGFFGYLPNIGVSDSLLLPIGNNGIDVGNFTSYPIAVEPKKYELFYKSVKSLKVSFEINLSDGVNIGEEGTRIDLQGSGSNELNLPVLSTDPVVAETRSARNFTSPEFLTPSLLILDGFVGQFDARVRQWDSQGNLISDTTDQLDFLITIQLFGSFFNFRPVVFDSTDYYPSLAFSTDFFNSVATTTPDATKEVPFADWGNVTAAFSDLDETGTNSLSIEIDETF